LILPTIFHFTLSAVYRQIQVKRKGRIKETRVLKVLLDWNKAQACMARRKREEKLEEASPIP